MRTLTCAELALTPDRTRCRVAGIVVTRQRPGTASGVIFVTLEDETGIANVIVWPKTYERFRRAVISGRLLRVTGQLQREGSVHHLIAWKIEDLSHLLDRLGRPEAPGSADGARSRVPHSPKPDHPREQAKNIFPSRDFH
jgi:error-prone DNA polymerase